MREDFLRLTASFLLKREGEYGEWLGILLEKEEDESVRLRFRLRSPYLLDEWRSYCSDSFRLGNH